MVYNWVNLIKSKFLRRKIKKYDREEVLHEFKHKDHFSQLKSIVRSYDKKGKDMLKHHRSPFGMKRLEKMVEKVKEYEENKWKNIPKREAEDILRKLKKMSHKKL